MRQADLREQVLAVENAVALEEVAASTLRARQIDASAPDIDPGLLTKHFQRKHGTAAYYGQAEQL